MAGATGGPDVSAGVAGLAVVATGLVAGLIVWQLSRIRQRRLENQASRTIKQITLLIEHTDCLLWEAQVEMGPGEWKWDFTLHTSALSRKLFGDQLPSAEVGLWYQLKIPERAEMDRRSREAIQNRLPGYEQQFRVDRDGRALWLNESVSITPSGPNRFWLVGLVTDITAQHEAEQGRHASEEKLNQLMAHANCLLWQAHVTRDEAGIFHWEWFVPRSELYRRMVGENPGQKAIMPWGLINVPEFPELEARSRDAMQRGLPGYEQVFRVIKGNEVLWMHEQASVTHLGNNHWKIEGVVIDITAQRQAEEAQKTSESRLEQLLERADCMIWQGHVKRLPGDELSWAIFLPRSQLYRRIFGRDPDSANIFQWGEVGVPEVSEMRKLARHALFSGMEGYEQRFHVPNPERDIWLVEQVNISPAGSEEWNLVGIITDITARHEAEEAQRTSKAQLQQILELADCMVWEGSATTMPDGSLDWKIYTPPRSMLYRRLFGDEVDSETLDWRLLDVPEMEEMNRRADQALRTHASSYEQEFRVISPLRVTWLHEVVTIIPGDSDRYRMVGVITDITAQREAQEARRASEDQMREILSGADCLLWQARVFRIGPDNLRWVMYIPPSRLYREVFGSDPPDPPVLLWLQVIDEATNRENNARSTKAILSGAPGYEHEFRAQRGTRVFWLHEKVSISSVGPGEWRLVGVMTDLTARRGAEQAVRASEVRYHSLFQHTPVAIVETDFSKVGLWLNELRTSGVNDLAAWLDQDPKRLYLGAKLVRVSDSNETAQVMLRARKPSDFRRRRGVLATPDSLRVIRATLLALWEGRNTLEEQLEMRDFEGGLHYMNIRWWIAQSESGLDLSQSVLVFVDLTELKQTEAALASEKERLAVTLQAMAEGVVTTDITGRVQFINPAAMVISQWDAGAIGRPITEIFVLENDRTGASFAVPFTQVARGDAVIELPAQTRLVTRSGQHRLVDGCCAPIHSADNQVIGLVLVFRDITEHERLEQELVRATRLESVGILAGGIAHDFNNILTGVMGNLALAQLDIDANTDSGTRLREAEKAALRARDLTQQLLTFAKGGEPVRAAVQLEAILRETANFALHGSNVKAIYHIPADLWSVDADKGQIGRVVQNLVINAVQAMPAGGTLRLNACNEKITGPGHTGLAPGDYVQIAIADTGEGIKPDHLARIFDPYFTTKQTGSGLGLAAVYSIVRKHHGYIDVESQIGQGSTFHIWLPALQTTRVASAPPMPESQNRFEGRVLFMDDEEPIRRMAGQMLRRLGFEVEGAVDGVEAVEKFSAARAAGEPFTLVIMDLTVPGGIGGREAIIQLREIDPLVKAIVSSGYSSDPVLANFRAHGFCGVVAKPYKLDDFIKAVREALTDQRT